MSELEVLQSRPTAREGASHGARSYVHLLAPPPLSIDAACHMQYQSMLEIFQATGGLETGDAVAQRLAIASDQPISKMARWIVDRLVVNFRWRSQTLVPLFQFDLVDMSLRDEASKVVRELVNVFDDWEMARWFSEPNCWLCGEVPAQLLLQDPLAVFEAARGDRFALHG